MSIEAVKCRLRTGGKTAEQIRERYAGQTFTDEEIAAIQQSHAEFDGLILTLARLDDKEGYFILSCDAEHLERVKSGLYYAEQVSPFPYYLNDRESFERDWAANEYAPDCAFVFDPADVEEIEPVSGTK
jgi:hypothetical protein